MTNISDIVLANEKLKLGIAEALRKRDMWMMKANRLEDELKIVNRRLASCRQAHRMKAAYAKDKIRIRSYAVIDEYRNRAEKAEARDQAYYDAIGVALNCLQNVPVQCDEAGIDGVGNRVMDAIKELNRARGTHYLEMRVTFAPEKPPEYEKEKDDQART